MVAAPGWDAALDRALERVKRHGLFMLSGTMIEPAASGNACVVIADFGRDPALRPRALRARGARARARGLARRHLAAGANDVRLCGVQFPCAKGERPVVEIDVDALCDLQSAKTAEWHVHAYAVSRPDWLGLVEENHHCNFELWHEEDKARRDDLGYEHVYRAKRNIDAWNQRRNDAIEGMDRWLWERLPEPPQGMPRHSETPGMIVDRLSILALKQFHMREEARRASAPVAQRDLCEQKLAVIHQQRLDLRAALEGLLEDVRLQRRGFRLYRQFKMYNDPALNPELYAARK